MRRCLEISKWDTGVWNISASNRPSEARRFLVGPGFTGPRPCSIEKQLLYHHFSQFFCLAQLIRETNGSQKWSKISTQAQKSVYLTLRFYWKLLQSKYLLEIAPIFKAIIFTQKHQLAIIRILSPITRLLSNFKYWNKNWKFHNQKFEAL